MGFGLEAVGLLIVAGAGAGCLRLIARARRRVRQIGELSDAIRSTLRARGRAEGVDELLAAVQRMVGADEAWLVLVERGAAKPLAAERKGSASTRLRPTHLTRPERALAKHMQDPDRDVVRSGRRAPAALEAVLQERGVAHGMATVVQGVGGAWAMLFVGRRGGRRFGADERDLLALVAEHAGAVLENDRLERSLREVVSLKEELRHRADHDTLTGLPNRALFAARVDAAARAARATHAQRGFAVLFLDLDDFKDVNDTLGHQAGDELLVAVAKRLSNTIRPTDVGARLGGDEFAVLVECFNPHDGEHVAARLVTALNAPFRIEGREVLVHASIGIAYGASGVSGDDVLRNADLAMYEAKQCGKRRWACYEPAMQDRLRQRHELVTALERAALHGEIGVHYQPIVDLATGRPVAVEALARWQRPARGLVGPSGFLALADEVGLMSAIGRTVRREACAQTRAWQQLFPSHERLGVAVNLAPSELHDDDLIEDVRRTLEETGLHPACLTLEITESGVMHDPDTALRRLHELRALGVSLALDDFGTGHSSLAHLRAFPLDVLKIAQPFVEGLIGGGRDAAFIETIVRLGTSLELDVVAEGIETSAQADTATALACDLGQGFHFGRPLAPLGITGYLTAERLPAAAPGFSTAA